MFLRLFISLGEEIISPQYFTNRNQGHIVIATNKNMLHFFPKIRVKVIGQSLVR